MRKINPTTKKVSSFLERKIKAWANEKTFKDPEPLKIDTKSDLPQINCYAHWDLNYTENMFEYNETRKKFSGAFHVKFVPSIYEIVKDDDGDDDMSYYIYVKEWDICHPIIIKISPSNPNHYAETESVLCHAKDTFASVLNSSLNYLSTPKQDMNNPPIILQKSDFTDNKWEYIVDTQGKFEDIYTVSGFNNSMFINGNVVNLEMGMDFELLTPSQEPENNLSPGD